MGIKTVSPNCANARLLEYTPLYTGLNYGTKIDLSPTFTLLEYTLSLSKKPLY